MTLASPWGPVSWTAWEATAATPDAGNVTAVIERLGDAELRRIQDNGDAAIAMLPRRQRLTLSRRLRNTSVRSAGAVLLVPRWPGSEHALAIGPTLADGVERHLEKSRAAAIVAAAARNTWGRWLVTMMAPGVGVVLTPTGKDERDGDWPGCRPAAGHVSLGSRSDAPTLRVLLYEANERRPCAVAKLAFSPAAVPRIAAEIRALVFVAPSAARAGLRVPRLLGHKPGKLTMTAVSGHGAAGLLRRRPRRLGALVADVLDSLATWRALRSPALLDEETYVRCFRAPASSLASAHPELAEYCAALMRDAERLVGVAPIVGPQHGDLTTRNVVIEPGAAVGITDFEAGTTGGVLLTDDWYLAADALGAALGTTHADAVVQLRDAAGSAAAIADQLDRAGRAVGWSPEIRELVFRQCWVAHAHDEVARPGAPQRFVEAVRRLARSG